MQEDPWLEKILAEYAEFRVILAKLDKRVVSLEEFLVLESRETGHAIPFDRE